MPGGPPCCRLSSSTSTTCMIASSVWASVTGMPSGRACIRLEAWSRRLLGGGFLHSIISSTERQTAPVSLQDSPGRYTCQPCWTPASSAGRIATSLSRYTFHLSCLSTEPSVPRNKLTKRLEQNIIREGSQVLHANTCVNFVFFGRLRLLFLAITNTSFVCAARIA